MHGEAHVGERVLHFGAFVKAEAADQFVANATAAKGFFKSAGLEIGAVFDGAGLIGIVFQKSLQFAGDKFGFGLGVASFKVAKVLASRLLGAEGFAESVRIIFNDGAGGVQNTLRGTVVAFEANDFGAGKIARKAEQNTNVRAAPPIDRLVLVADDADILVRADQQAQQIVLHAIGILIFVDVNVSEALLPSFANLRDVA